MAGLYELLKVWADDETLSNSDLNAEFANIRDNFVAEKVEGYSTLNNVNNIDRINATIDPAPGGDPLASTGNSSVAGEIQKLRFAIARILGEGEWWESPQASLANKSRPIVCSSLASLEAAYGVGFYPIVPSAPFTASSCTLASGGKFSPSCIEMPRGEVDFYPVNEKKFTVAFFIKNLSINSNIFFHPSFPMSMDTDGSGNAVFRIYSKRASTDSAKVLYTINTNQLVISTTQWTHIMLTVDASGADGEHSIYIYINGENGPAGSEWKLTGITLDFSLAMNTPLRFGSQYAAAHGSIYRSAMSNFFAFLTDTPAGLTRSVGAGGSTSVSNGELTLTAEAAAVTYTAAASANNIQFAIKTNYENGITGGTALSAIPCQVFFRRSNQSIRLYFSGSNIVVSGNASGTVQKVIFCDNTSYRDIRVGVDSGAFYIWIDGVEYSNFGFSGSDVGADTVQFGLFNAAGSTTCSASLKYFAYDTGAYKSQYETFSSNNLQFCEMVVYPENVSPGNAVISSLQVNPAELVFSGSTQARTPTYSFAYIDDPEASTAITASVLTRDSRFSWNNVNSDGRRKILFSAKGLIVGSGAGNNVYCAFGDSKQGTIPGSLNGNWVIWSGQNSQAGQGSFPVSVLYSKAMRLGPSSMAAYLVNSVPGSVYFAFNTWTFQLLFSE